MKIIYLFGLIFILTSDLFSQDNSCGWEFDYTASNATIAIQQGSAQDFMIYDMCMEYQGTAGWFPSLITSCDIWISVCYTDDNGELACGGIAQWDNTQNFALTAWGDDPTTIEKDGFYDGEEYTFMLCVDGYGELSQNENGLMPLTMSNTTPFSENYGTNAFASIDLVGFDACGGGGADYSPNGLCGTVGLLDQNLDKKIIKTIDMFGREIRSDIKCGFSFNIYSDKTISKIYRF